MSRLDDRKCGLEVDQQREQLGYCLGVSASRDLTVLDRIRERSLSQNEAFEHGARRRYRSHGIGSGLARDRGQCAMFQG